MVLLMHRHLSCCVERLLQLFNAKLMEGSFEALAQNEVPMCLHVSNSFWWTWVCRHVNVATEIQCKGPKGLCWNSLLYDNVII